MKKKSEPEKKTRKYLIDGATFSRKVASFSAFEDVSGNAVRISLTEELPDHDKGEVLLYDFGANEYLNAYNCIFKEKEVQFEYEESVRKVYDRGIKRYTPVYVLRDKKTIYTFTPARQPEVDEYDRMENIMLKQGLWDREIDGAAMAGLFYYSFVDDAVRLSVLDDYLAIEGFLEAKVKNIYLKNGIFRMKYSLKDHGYKLTRVYMSLRNSLEDRHYDLIINENKKGDIYTGTISIDLKGLQLGQFYWDIKGEAVDENGFTRRILLKNRTLWMHRLLYLRQLMYKYPDGNIVYPYKTKSRDIALQFRPATKQDNHAFVMKEYVAIALYYLLLPVLKKRNIWLVYEKYSQSAQDNSYYFFKYCMEKLPPAKRKHIYYVIDPASPDYKYVEKYGRNLISFLSLKHQIYLLGCRLLISSDTKAHAYAWHSPDSVYRNMLRRNENVFLQHGVIAFKCCHQGLRKKSFNASNLFVVSSDVEKQIILDYFGYEEKEILVTGLARWDVLTDKSEGEKPQIVLMPTWRTWLEEVSKEEFMESDYYKNYMALLHDRLLIDTLEKYDITMYFYIHPKFREYMENFSSGGDRIKLVPFGSIPLNELMMKCSMMITDYSSAVWDVYYQGKPVLFYLFDIDMYNEVQGSYIDMETEAFGDTTRSPKQLSALIAEYAENGFKEKEKYAAKRSRLIKYIDDRNSERTYKEIIKRYPR